MNTLGQRVKLLRKEKKLTLRQLGKITHLSHSFLADIESGRSVPSVETLAILADILEVSTDYLLGRSDLRNPEALPREDLLANLPLKARESVLEYVDYIRKKYQAEE